MLSVCSVDKSKGESNANSSRYRQANWSFTPADRVKIIDMVIRDTIKPDTEIENIWIREAEVRWDSFVRGQMKAISFEEVMGKYQEKR